MDSLSSKVALSIAAVIALSALSATIITLTGEDSGWHSVESGLQYQPIAAEIAPSGLRQADPQLPMSWSDEWYDIQKALRDNAVTAQDVQAY
jgi:hypothetical protein